MGAVLARVLCASMCVRVARMHVHVRVRPCVHVMLRVQPLADPLFVHGRPPCSPGAEYGLFRNLACMHDDHDHDDNDDDDNDDDDDDANDDDNNDDDGNGGDDDGGDDDDDGNGDDDDY